MPKAKKIPLIDKHGSWISGSSQIEEGTWYRMPTKTPEVAECCDCGLVHITEYKIVDGKIFWRTTVDRKATRAARRREGVTVQRRKFRT